VFAAAAAAAKQNAVACCLFQYVTRYLPHTAYSIPCTSYFILHTPFLVFGFYFMFCRVFERRALATRGEGRKKAVKAPPKKSPVLIAQKTGCRPPPPPSVPPPPSLVFFARFLCVFLDFGQPAATGTGARGQGERSKSQRDKKNPEKCPQPPKNGVTYLSICGTPPPTHTHGAPYDVPANTVVCSSRN
jgi:hypothetical protein